MRVKAGGGRSALSSPPMNYRPVTLALLVPWLFVVVARAASATADTPWSVDGRYAPAWWQTSICLPDDWQKTLVSKEGSLLYDYPGNYSGFGTRITAGWTEPGRWVGQELVAPRVPVVRTLVVVGGVEVVEEGFAVTPPRARLGDAGSRAAAPVPRHDGLLLQVRNRGDRPAELTPTLTIESRAPLLADPARRRVTVGTNTVVDCPIAWVRARTNAGGLVLEFPRLRLAPGGQATLAYGVGRGTGPRAFPRTVAEARRARRQAERYWRHLDLPYGHLEVPDAGIQARLDSSIRNIYQAREIKQGLPAFQVGPTCYRGLWVVDGSFLLEAMTFLGRTNETRAGIAYLLSFQRPDGGFMLIDGHWKETGIALWALTRHARLTGDPGWLRTVWPRVERGVAFIRHLRTLPPADAPNAGLIPDGFSDGGLAERVPEYTNVYWTLAGLRAAVEAARWLGETTQAEAWQRDYDDFLAAFRRAAQRDLRTDPHGNRYLPIRMRYDPAIPPQKAQWGFLHALYPGEVFAPDDALVRGNMAMLRAVELEGLVQDTGWLKNGLWNYFGSFYAHAWLWLGEGDKAARTLVAFANHTSPLLVWREEQMPVGQGAAFVGDMPHNWASAEFIRLVRHCLALERGGELHLFEGLPAAWVHPGAVLQMRDIQTDFGPLTLSLRVSGDGRTATLRLRPPRRSPPARLLVHLDHWSGQTGTLALPTQGPVVRQFTLSR